MSTQQTSLLTDLSTIFSDNFSFNGFWANFHFIRPWWLLAFFALFLLLFLLKKIRYYQSPWQHFLPPHLASTLLESSQNSPTEVISTSKSRYWLKPLVIGCCVIIALAGPAWQKLPQPVFQLKRGAVLVMDMSYSMYATDVKPNRLTRARYKAVDLLTKINEGDIGLIAYAGDAFIISPLTQDIKNIELLLPSLSPDIMPVHGANALAALSLADKTLRNAGHVSGDIYWFTDDIDNEEMSDVYEWSENNNHQVNILGVGSKSGAPIKLSSGKLLKDDKGGIVIPKLPAGKLAAITKRNSGVYRTLTNDDSDIRALTSHLSAKLDEDLNNNTQQDEQIMQGDQYQEHGPWLLLIILPLMLSYFRRGNGVLSIVWLLPLTLGVTLMTTNSAVYAQEANVDPLPKKQLSSDSEVKANTSTAGRLWRDLWQTSDQQGQQYFKEKQYQEAAKQFNNDQWQGSAHYRAGNFEKALEAFKQSDSATSLYNQGNSLAQLQKIDEAIDAYKRALEKDPSLSDAQDNLEKLEALKKQQEQSQQSQDGEQDKQQDKQQQDSEQQSKDKSQQDSQQNQQEQDAPQQGESQESDKDNQKQEQQEQSSQESQESKENKGAEQKEDTPEDRQEDKEANQAEKSEQEATDEKSLAQQASDNKAQETQQKHKQLLNKVTDDPYLLLRNKMRLEYQKRRHHSAPQGEKKKW